VYAATPARMFPGRRQRRARARRQRGGGGGGGLAAGWLQAGCILFLARFACGRFAIEVRCFPYFFLILA
jgi:hypothetical protein